MPVQPVKISVELYNKVKEIAEKRGASIRSIVEKALGLYLQGYDSNVIDKEIKGIIAKPIITKFRAKCYKCGREIKPGEPAYFIKVTYTDNTSRSWLLHLGCYAEEFDESLAKAVIKREKIKSEIKSLEKYEKKLIEHITSELEYIDRRLEEIRKELEEIRGFDEYYRLIPIFEDIKNIFIDVKQVLERREEAKTPKKQLAQ